MNNNKQFYTIEESYKERFFRLPKVFFTNPNYMKLKNVSKIAYAILQDRLQLSIKNKWVDDAGRIYFVYTDKKLMEILNISKNHVTTVKKELINVGLLIQKRQGLNKPNISYLLKPEITHEDIYKIETAETDVETSDDTDSHTVGIQNHTQRESRITHKGNQESHTVGTNDTDISDTDISDTDINDMNYLNEKVNRKSHSNHSNNQTSKFDIESLKELELQEFPEHLKTYLLNFNIEELKIIKEIILKAKSSFNTRIENDGYYYMLEDIEQELIVVLKRFKGYLVKKNETPKAMEKYLMRSITNEIEEYHSLNLRRKNFNYSS
ncbi:TPA: replication protein [Staphylococcus aureus]|nr:replication protein [Staphylococcus aureus]